MIKPNGQSFDLDEIARQLVELAAKLRELAETPVPDAANENLATVGMQSEAPTTD
jgi:hypothetical protein